MPFNLLPRHTPRSISIDIGVFSIQRPCLADHQVLRPTTGNGTETFGVELQRVIVHRLLLLKGQVPLQPVAEDGAGPTVVWLRSTPKTCRLRRAPHFNSLPAEDRPPAGSVAPARAPIVPLVRPAVPTRVAIRAVHFPRRQTRSARYGAPRIPHAVLRPP